MKHDTCHKREELRVFRVWRGETNALIIQPVDVRKLEDSLLPLKYIASTAMPLFEIGHVINQSDLKNPEKG